MSLATESRQLPIKEALAEAAEMKKEVGEKGTPEEYAQAHSGLIEKQTKELLAKKDWLGVLNFTVTLVDRIEKTHRNSKNMERENSQKKKSILESSNRLEDLQNDENLLNTANQKMTDGGNTLSVELYNALFFGMMSVAKEKRENELRASITEKLSEAHHHNRENAQDIIQEITLSAEELDFLKKAIVEIIKETGTDIKNLSQSVDEQRKKYESNHNQQQSLDQELTDLNEILETTIEILDKREEEKGAPTYPESSQTTEEQYLAYTQRIQWRRDQINRTKYGAVERGDEISRKWAIYANINGQYLLLNKKNVWDDVDPIDIVVNRIPEETYGVYAEGMVMKHNDGVPLQAVMRNGAIQHISYEEREKRAKDLEPHQREIKRQLD